jgi:Zinc finger, C3HC4 type (RING finger)
MTVRDSSSKRIIAEISKSTKGGSELSGKKFIDEISYIGFPKEDVLLVLDKKGLYSFDRSLVLELLSAMATIPELMAEKQAILDAAAKEKADAAEALRKQEAELNRFGDERDAFLYEVPCLAPKGFKPLKRHRALCKICYENRINCAFMPCKCQLFCLDCCYTPDMLQGNCPLCGENIEDLIKLYDIKQQLKGVRQL